MLRRLASGLALVAVVTLAMASSSGDQPASANGCTGAASYSWDGTVISYGIRDFTVSFCGSASLDALAGLQTNGNKNLALALVEPNGTVHVFTGSRSVSGVVEEPLAWGDWTLVVRNLSPSNLRFHAALSFQE